MEFVVLNYIQHYLRCPVLDFFMPLLSHLGDFGVLWLVMAVILLASKKYRILGLGMLLALAINYLLSNLLLKTVVARMRPCHVNLSVHLLTVCPASFAFPSGHASASFAAAFMLAASRFKFWPAFVGLAALIAFSRLYLYVHFPSDVLAGALIGTASGLAALWLVKRFYAY